MSVKATLELLHKTWPTENGVRHNVTLPSVEHEQEAEGDNIVSLTIFIKDTWYEFLIDEADFLTPEALITSMKAGLESLAN